MPSFDQNDNLTKLLYSKFIVKGVKPINHDAIVNKLRRQSRESNQPKKNHTRSTSQATRENIVRQANTK